MVPVGSVVYTVNTVNALYSLYEVLTGTSNISVWVAGPLERMFVGPLILTCAFWMTSVPVLNIVSSFLLGWLANLDYYGYNYQLGLGPTLPKSKK